MHLLFISHSCLFCSYKLAPVFDARDALPTPVAVVVASTAHETVRNRIGLTTKLIAIINCECNTTFPEVFEYFCLC